MGTTVSIYGGCVSKLRSSELELVGSMWELLGNMVGLGGTTRELEGIT